MMAAKFLNLGDEEPKIGTGLKKKPRTTHARVNPQAIARAGEAHGFTRSTEPADNISSTRRGRPPLNEGMTYWRIYISPQLRDQLNSLRDQEGRRLNDVLQDMLAAYRASKRQVDHGPDHS